MGFREKLLDFKRRLSDRKMYSIVIAVIGVFGVWGFYQYKHAADLRQELDNQYNRAFYDMVGYVNNVEVLLVKSLITNTPAKTAATLQEAWRQANLAQTNLGQLPVSPQVLSNTSKFLTQVGDLAYSLNNQNVNGKALSNEQYKTLEQLHGFSVSLNNSLAELQSSLSTGRMRWGELANKGSRLFQKTSAKLQMEQIENIDKTFQEYPTLIYDGPFSDHMTSVKPKGLTGDNLKPEQGKQKVIDFFGADRVKAVTYTEANNAEPIKTYSYNVTFKNASNDQSANIDITQKGGHVYWMLYNRSVPKENISVDQAKAKGKSFLESRGFKNMTDTYYLKEDNTATINYAYTQDNVIVYPDLIKVKIALDTGDVIGIEAKGYLSSHSVRTIPTAKVTMEQARASINKKMTISSEGMAMIPTEYKTEVFTYEFKGKLDKQDFIVYINAENGREEDILLLLNTPNGILTM